MNILLDADIQLLIGHAVGCFMLGWACAILLKVVKKIGENL